VFCLFLLFIDDKYPEIVNDLRYLWKSDIVLGKKACIISCMHYSLNCPLCVYKFLILSNYTSTVTAVLMCRRMI
jgi:hypothetical protein